MLKGALHIHSTYSDGELTLRELRDVYAAAGCRFACITDHADAFDATTLDAYVRECAELSNDSFLFVPGLEFTCTDRMHIIGYGVTTLTDEADPCAVIQHVARCGGISVVAHPKDAHFAWIGRFDSPPDGLEVWNSKYDGRYAPRPATFALLRHLQTLRPDVRAFYGQDLHWRTQYRGLYVQLAAAALTREVILDSLRLGQYSGHKEQLLLPSDGSLPEPLLKEMARSHRRSDYVRHMLRSIKRTADRLHLRIPAAVKAHARRVM
jgi:hypothetical protein